MTIRTRFSPSPTGFIHLGNVRTAFFSALYATKHAGHFVLRIEDTDAARSETRFVQALEHDLQWLGIKWQEGPEVGGEYGPYWQSERQSIYAKYYDQLEQLGRIYPCFCSDQELNLARKSQLAKGQAPRYNGKCKALTADAIQALIASGKQPAWRFSVPLQQLIEFIDVVKGPQKFNSSDIGDFIVRRADSTSPFLFCNAIDDATMEISHVLRGDDHLANTPRQILILQALNLRVPNYGHLSLIVGADGAPLSKRHGSFSLQEMRSQGYLPIALANYLARLGHSFDDNTLLDFAHLAQHFNLEKLSKSAARFDESQLLYWQKQAVQQLSDAEFWQWLGDDISALVPAEKHSLFAKTIRANIAFPREALAWANDLYMQNFNFAEQELAVLQSAGHTFFQQAINGVEEHGCNLAATFNALKAHGITGKKLFMPIRIALTNQQHGPELGPIAELMGKDKLLQRLQQAQAAISVDIT